MSFVLVHGGWLGAWCWRRVRPLLQAAGYEVFAPTLTGLGERAHLLSPDIGLMTHVQDVVGLIEAEELQDIVLVGQSYAGMVITGVADRVPERLSHVVYLDAFVPRDGQSLADLVGPEMMANLEQAARAQGSGWRVPPLPPQACGVTDEKGCPVDGAQDGCAIAEDYARAAAPYETEHRTADLHLLWQASDGSVRCLS